MSDITVVDTAGDSVHHGRFPFSSQYDAEAQHVQQSDFTKEINVISMRDSTSHSSITSIRESPVLTATEKAPAAVDDWNGPDDLINPMNWSTAKKSYHMFVVGLQCFVITYGTSVYAPAVTEVADAFNVSITAALVPLSVYLLGLGFGPMISAPISETWGRRQVYITLFPISVLFSLGASLAQNFSTLIVCRLLAGLFGSGCLAVGGGSNADMFTAMYRAPTLALFILCPFFGPCLGPPIGSYAAQYKNWRWPLYTIVMFGALTIALSLFTEETYKKILLRKRARQLKLPAPPVNDKPSVAAQLKMIVLITLLRPLRMLVTEPVVALLSAYTAFVFAVMYAFFATFPLIFQSPYPQIQIYHFSLGESGLVFLSIGVGCLISVAVTITIDRRSYVTKVRRKMASGDTSPLPPEERLLPAMLGSTLLLISLFWFAWTARSNIHWIMPVLSMVFFGLGNLLVFTATILYLMDTYGARYGASAVAANGLLRYALGAVFPLFMRQMTLAIGVAWTISIFGFISVGLCPLPWVFYRWGPKIRARSGYT